MAANFVKMAANQDLTYAAEGSLIRSRGFSHTQHARFYLARLLERKGDREGSGKLRTEILKLYPDALTHRGGRMADSFRKAE